MVEKQLQARGISDEKVLAAMSKIPRHLFVAPSLKMKAYSNSALPIEESQTISQPYMVAVMTQALQIKGGERVLEIGAGSGYQAAVLAEMGARVFTIERIPRLATAARKLLESLGYQNIAVIAGDGTLGWPEFAPYDRIIVTAGAPNIPEKLLAQLKDEGIMVIPVGDKFGQTLKIIQRKGNTAITRDSVKCIFVPLIGKEGWDKNNAS